MEVGFRPSSSGLGPSIFTSLAPLPDNNTKSNRAALESHLASGSATALLNEQLQADALAARQRTADWAAQRRKAGMETALSEVQRGKRRRIEQGHEEQAEERIEVPEVERPDRKSAVGGRDEVACMQELITSCAQQASLLTYEKSCTAYSSAF